MGEFLNLCQCKLVNLRREADEIVAELRCQVQEAGAPEAGETAEQRAKAPAVKVLRQESVPGQILLER